MDMKLHYIYYMYIIVCVKANLTLYNENCSDCYRDAAIENFNGILGRHWYEVTVSTNPSVKRSVDVLLLHNKCKGAIITTNMIITLASFFLMDATDFEEFVVYSGYLILEENENLRVHRVDKVFVHPKFIKGSNVDNIAVAKVREHFTFNISGDVIAMLPDNFMDFAKNKAPVCTVLYHQTDAFGMDVLRSLQVNLLTKEECADLIRLDNLTLSLNLKSFCVKPNTLSNKLTNITEGASCICNGVIRGVITEAYNDMNINHPLPVVDIAQHTNWIREKMININRASEAQLIHASIILPITIFILILKI